MIESEGIWCLAWDLQTKGFEYMAQPAAGEGSNRSFQVFPLPCLYVCISSQQYILLLVASYQSLVWRGQGLLATPSFESKLVTLDLSVVSLLLIHLQRCFQAWVHLCKISHKRVGPEATTCGSMCGNMQKLCICCCSAVRGRSFVLQLLLATELRIFRYSNRFRN